jgi:signal transduction histidine kinase
MAVHRFCRRFAGREERTSSRRRNAVALPREAPDARSAYDRPARSGVIVQHPAAEGRYESAEQRSDEAVSAAIGVVESRVRDEARLEGVRLAAREIAHLLNNDLAVAVGFVDLLQTHSDLPDFLRDLLVDAISSLDSAARHIEELQGVVRIVVKETPAGESLDLERSRAS